MGDCVCFAECDIAAWCLWLLGMAYLGWVVFLVDSYLSDDGLGPIRAYSVVSSEAADLDSRGWPCMGISMGRGSSPTSIITAPRSSPVISFIALLSFYSPGTSSFVINHWLQRASLSAYAPNGREYTLIVISVVLYTGFR